MKQTILSKYISEQAASELGSIQQGSESWHKRRVKTVGGSEVATIIGKNKYQTVVNLILNKCGIGDKFTGSYATRWGNLFEPVIASYVEEELNTDIVGSDLYIAGAVPCQTYSPDGLGVVLLSKEYKLNDDYENDDSENNAYKISRCETSLVFNQHKKPIYPKLKTIDSSTRKPQEPYINNLTTYTNHIALFEFKCPSSRKINGKIPDEYLPQVLTGLDTISIADIGVFVEASFRRCSFPDLEFTTPFNKIPANSLDTGLLPLAIGFFGFYSPLDKLEEPAVINIKKNLESNPTYEHGIYDLGALPLINLDAILYGIEQRTVNYYYSQIIFDKKNIKELNEDYKKILELSATHHVYGVMGWKLFRADFHIVERTPGGFIFQYAELIRGAIETVGKCIESPDSYYEEITAYLRAHPEYSHIKYVNPKFTYE